MCKIAVISGINKNNRENVWKFVYAMSKSMSSGMDKDGFGYAAVSNTGELFSERWLNNEESFSKREARTPFDAKQVEDYQGFLDKPVTYDSYGDLDYDNVTSITLHARFATSGKGFMNTHPFIVDDNSLIHNGVISNHDTMKKTISTCDSEVILQEYISRGVANNPSNIQKVADKLEGYYACAVFSNHKKHGRILDVFKDRQANLVCAYVKELETNVIATSYENIINAAKDCEFTISSWYGVWAGKLLRINAVTGQVISTTKFKPEYKHGGKSYKSGNNYTSGVGNQITSIKQNTHNTTSTGHDEYVDDWVQQADKSWVRKSVKSLRG